MNMTMTQINKGRDREVNPLAKRKFPYQNMLGSKQTFMPSPPRHNMMDISPASTNGDNFSISPHVQSRMVKGSEVTFQSANMERDSVRLSGAYGVAPVGTADKLTASNTPTPFKPIANVASRDFQSPMRNQFNLATISDRIGASPHFAHSQ